MLFKLNVAYDLVIKYKSLFYREKSMLLIKNAKILTMTGVNYDNGCILIEGKKIVKVEGNINVNSKDMCEIIDARNYLVMPGLIEAHCHIGITEEKKRFRR